MKKYLSILLFCAVSVSIFAQRTLTGKVTDGETGEPLIGANILVAETSTGTVTDYDGNYSVQLPKEATQLNFSYTGYESRTIKITDANVLDVVMLAGKTLDKVLVIGYETIEKSDKTGAIESVEIEDEEVQQYDDFQSFLQGRAKGVYIQGSGNELLAPNSIRIRGANSLTGNNEPLYVVDGIIINSAGEDTADPLSGGSSYLSPQNGLTGINPQDIMSVEILKDASATAIYGSRGANGVILITTKQGKKGKPKFNYKATARFGQATNLIDVLDTDEYLAYQNEYRELQGFQPNLYQYEDGSIAQFAQSEAFMLENSDSIPRLTPVNWYEDVFQTSVTQNHRLSVSGGSEKSTYYLAGGYTNAQGYIPNMEAEQGDFLLNFKQQLGERLEINPRISAAFIKNSASKGTENIGGNNTSLIRQITLAAPLVGYSENNSGLDVDEIVDGPRAWLRDYDDDSKEFRTLASLKLNYKLSEVFTYSILAAGDYRNKQRQVWFGNTIARGRLSNGEAGISSLDRFRYNIDNTLSFKTKIGRKNRLNGVVGVVLDGTNIEQSTFTASNFANQDLRAEGISFGQNFTPLQYDRSEETILSYLGRANYSHANKYLLTLSFRADGSSKFAEGNKYSFFPSAAFAWKINNEKFLKNSTLISDAKLRIGYGRTGNQAIRPYQTFSRFGPTGNLLPDPNGGGQTAIIPLNIGNQNLIWETTDQFNAGIDFGFQNDRFTGSLDIYHKKTQDLLQVLNIGPSAGFQTIITNQGSLVNRGVELGVEANILQGELKWTVFGNISFNRNEIQDLGLPPAQFGTQTYSAYLGRNVSGGTAFKVPANIFIEGQPAGLFWGYATDGIINTAADLENAPTFQGTTVLQGDIFYIDQNGDGNINDEDLTIIGDPNPDYTFGLGSQLSFKGLSLNFLFNGVQGNEVANGNLGRAGFAFGNADNLLTEVYEGAWREGSTDATHPRLGHPLNGDFNDRMVEDGSFVRLTFVSLGYNLPVKNVKGLQSASVFVTGHNLLLFTDYSGFDPEVNSFAFDPSRIGIDWGSFPNQKAVSFGLNVTF